MAEAGGGLKIAISGKVSGIPSTNIKSPLLTSDPTRIVSPAKSVGYFPADSHHDEEFVSRLMNLLPQGAIVSVRLSKKSLQCVCVCVCVNAAAMVPGRLLRHTSTLLLQLLRSLLVNVRGPAWTLELTDILLCLQVLVSCQRSFTTTYGAISQ